MIEAAYEKVSFLISPEIIKGNLPDKISLKKGKMVTGESWLSSMLFY